MNYHSSSDQRQAYNRGSLLESGSLKNNRSTRAAPQPIPGFDISKRVLQGGGPSSEALFADRKHAALR